MHARKTRERKKAESSALQQRITELNMESKALRQMVDERYTAGVLVGFKDEEQQANGIIPSAMICKDSFEEAASNQAFSGMGMALGILVGAGEGTSPQEKAKRARGRNKCTPQERLRLRRERNRMHAKRTRDRKKNFLEASEQIIADMESEIIAMRNYLLSIKVLTSDDLSKSAERDLLAKKQLALLLKGGCAFFSSAEERSAHLSFRTPSRPLSFSQPTHTHTHSRALSRFCRRRRRRC